MRSSGNRRTAVILTILLFLGSAGCANRMQIRQSPPEPNVTRSSIKLEELTNLPKPDRKIVVTVYRFQDKTGQFNDSDRLRYSTAVTQGATSQLITALMRAKYFTVVERAHLDDIITEQKLKIEKRVLANTGPSIGKMYGAEYIIMGDITEYNVDVVTAGAGVRISGAGGSAQVAVATAAIDLRIVESTSGRIVYNKSLRKSIVGKQVGVNIFRFWDNRLYEINGGVANQEPIQLAIRELLEEGVYSMCTSYAKAYEAKKVAARSKAPKERLAKKAVPARPRAAAPKRTSPVVTARAETPARSHRAASAKAERSPVSRSASKKHATAARKAAPSRRSDKTRPAWARDLYEATVKDPVVNVRMGPGLEYKRLFQVKKRQVLYVLEKNLVWNLVKTNGGDQGWIRTDKIEITGEPLSAASRGPDIQRIANPEGRDDIERSKKRKNLI